MDGVCIKELVFDEVVEDDIVSMLTLVWIVVVVGAVMAGDALFAADIVVNEEKLFDNDVIDGFVVVFESVFDSVVVNVVVVINVVGEGIGVGLRVRQPSLDRRSQSHGA